MKSRITLFFSVFLFVTTQAQEVPRKIVVEHFTNSRCSVCASRNPGFYTNYNNSNTGNMIHLAVHPSSPYSTCVFNMHDKEGNDDRTKYYGIFGSTPRLVINGSPVSASTSYNSASLFTPYVGATSPVSIKLEQQKFGNDSVRVRVTVKTVASHSLPAQNLYLALAEDIVFYNAPNGENEHYDVFRKALIGNTGTELTIPIMVGDSLVFMETVAAPSDWDLSRIYPLAILQDANTKEVTQANAISPNEGSVISGIRKISSVLNYSVYPTVASTDIRIETNTQITSTVRVISITGNLVFSNSFFDKTMVNVSGLANGVYFIAIENEDGIFTQKFIKN